jgi:hypothetical protein
VLAITASGTMTATAAATTAIPIAILLSNDPMRCY